MPSGFHEVQFPPAISYGCTGGPMYRTTVVKADSGAEQRISQWATGRLSWNVAQGVKSNVQMAALIAFFRARKGRAYGFRFKDWTDYKAALAPALPHPSLPNTLQLFVQYTDIAGTELRRITKPVLAQTETKLYAGIQLFQDGSPVDPALFAVNDTAGLVTTAGAGSGTWRWNGEFDVPCRFDTDEMKVSREGFNTNNWDSIPVMEIRVPED